MRGQEIGYIDTNFTKNSFKNFNIHTWHLSLNNIYRNFVIKLSFIILLVFQLSLHAEMSNLRFEKLTIEDGLSQNSCFSILQDQKGFMWFGTEDGLNRYDGYNFKVYKTESNDSSSISSNYIISMFEDNKGFLWIGTDGGGLNQYDRNKENFVRYVNIPDNENSLSQNKVNSICADASGNIWIGTNGGGLDKFNPVTKQFTHFKHDPENPNSLSSDMVFSVVWDKSGFLWIGTDKGLNKFDLADKSFTRYVSDPKNPSSLSNDYILNLLLDKTGTLWIGTFGGGLNKFIPNKNAGSSAVFISYKNDLKNPNSISGDVVTTIFEDKKGTLWIGTDGDGLNRLNINKYKSATFSHYKTYASDPKSIVNNRIFSLYQDRSGVLWIGTRGGGISKYNSEKKNFVLVRNQPNSKNSLSHNGVRVLTEDKSANLWIGTDGGGLDCFNPKTGLYTNYKNNPLNSNSLSYDFVRSIHQDREGYLWIGTDGGGINKFNIKTGEFSRYEHDPENPYSLGHNTIRPIFEDSKGSLWIGTYGAGLDLFDRKANKFFHFTNDPDNPNSISHNYIYCIHEDRSGVLWIGTDGGGLNQYNREKKIFKRFQHDPNNPNSISQDNIYSIYEDNSGILWLGTRGGGLNKFDPKNGSAIHYTEKDGMPNATVYGVLGDDNGNIWISTNKGLSRFDPKEEIFKNYDINDGIQSNEFNGGAYCKGLSGELFFGGINGFNRFFPDDIKLNNYIPPIVLTSFKVYDKELKLEKSISVIDEIELSYKQNFISFEFASLDYTNPEKNKYAYKLEGFDKEWINCGNRQYANYTNISGGEYFFRVKGTNSDGIWNKKGTQVKINIIPPFWETWWFQLLVCIMILAIAYMAYKIRIRSINKQKIQLQLQVEERTAELKSINNHLKKSRRESQRRADQALLLNDVGQKISSNLKLNILLNEVVEIGQYTFKYYAVLLFLLDEDGKKLTLQSKACVNKGLFPKNMTIKMGEGMIGKAAQAGNIQLSNDISNNSDYIQIVPEIIKSELVVPLKFGEKIFGVLDIESDELNAFDKADVSVVETFSTQIASAINNARLYEQAQNEIKVRKQAEKESRKLAKQSGLLNEVGQRISSELELNTVLNEIVNSAQDAFDYYGIMLFLPDRNKNVLSLQSISGGYKDVFTNKVLIKFGEGMIGKAFLTKKTQLSNDVSKNPDYVVKADEITKSELSVPIKDGNNVIGILDIQSDKLNAFDETDIATMETFSTQISAALKNASLYDHAQGEIKERKKAESQLRQSRDNLALAKNETDNILKNVEEGLFLINRDLEIESQYSTALENIFLTNNLGKINFTDFLKGKIADKLYESVEEYLELMFDNNVDEDTLNELNPLTEIEINFSDEQKGVFLYKYLSFKFKRIFSKNEIIELIVTVKDITDQVQLSKKLEESEEKTKKQMEWLLSILHVEPQLLQEFIEGVERELNTIDSLMKDGSKNNSYRPILDHIYRSIHLIKGNASILDLKLFMNSAHQFEENITEIQNRTDVSGKDYIPLILKLGDMRQNLNEIKGLIERITKFHTHFRPKRSYESHLLVTSIENLIKNLNSDTGKDVRLIHDNFQGDIIPYEYHLLIKDVLIQLVRNTIYHGIEKSEDRIKNNKNSHGTIKISSKIDDKSFVLKYYDDGRGIQLNKLKQKAKNTGKWNQNEIENWNDKQISDLIFEAGITTSEDSNLIAGRGLGMDIIKKKVISSGGTLDFSFASGQYCEFIVTLPINVQKEIVPIEEIEM